MKAFKIIFLFSSVVVIGICFQSCKKTNNNTPTDTVSKHINDRLSAYYPIKGNTSDVSGHNHPLNLLGGASLTYDERGKRQ